MCPAEAQLFFPAFRSPDPCPAAALCGGAQIQSRRLLASPPRKRDPDHAPRQESASGQGPDTGICRSVRLFSAPSLPPCIHFVSFVVIPPILIFFFSFVLLSGRGGRRLVDGDRLLVVRIVHTPELQQEVLSHRLAPLQSPIPCPSGASHVQLENLVVVPDPGLEFWTSSATAKSFQPGVDFDFGTPFSAGPEANLSSSPSSSVSGSFLLSSANFAKISVLPLHY